MTDTLSKTVYPCLQAKYRRVSSQEKGVTIDTVTENHGVGGSIPPLVILSPVLKEACQSLSPRFCTPPPNTSDFWWDTFVRHLVIRDAGHGPVG